MSLVSYFLLSLANAGDFNQSIQTRFSSSIDPPIVSKIFRDSRRLLWVGTQEGLYRFDGVDITRYGPDSFADALLPHSYIKGICEDRHGNLFIGTLGGGIYLYDRAISELQPLELISDPNLKNIDFMAKTQDSIVWASSRDLLAAIDPDSKKIISEIKIDSGKFNLGRLKGITHIKSGGYLLGSSTGLWKLQFSETREKFTVSELNNNGIQALTESSEEVYFVLNTGEIRKTTQTDPLNSETVITLPSEVSNISYISTFQGKLWIAAEQGLVSVDLSDFEIKITTVQNSALSANYITYLHPDKDTLWVGTFLGLNTLKQNNIELYNEKNSGVHYEVLAFSEDSSGTLWVGTYDGLFEKVPSSGFHTELELPEGQSLNERRIMTLASRHNELWIGFRSSGIQIFDVESRTLSSLKSRQLDKAEVTKILVDREDSVWIATYNQGLYLFKNGAVTRVNSIKARSITILMETSSGGILAASEQELYIRDGESPNFREVSIEFPMEGVTPFLLSIIESKSGALYFGTKDDGIYISTGYLDGNSSINLRRLGGSSTALLATIYGMLIDKEDKLWASTQEGIIALNTDGDFEFRLRKQDGLQDNDFNFGAAYQSESGWMYFGGVRGYNKLDSSNLVVDYSPPQLHMVSLKVPNKKFYTAGQKRLELLELGHEDYFVTFSFSTLNFASTGAERYRYKLEGFDPQWIDNGSRKSATYTNLPPGEYLFKVEGSSSAGIWSEDAISLNVRVLPPPWRTNWAYSVYAILILLVIWALKRIYDNHVIKERALKVAEEMVATADRAEDDLQEQQEVQDGLITASYKHNLALLDLIKEDSNRLDFRGGCVGRHVEILALLEECYCYQTDSLQADMHRFANTLVSRLLGNATVSAESISTVNSVTNTLIPAEMASPLALVMFELLHNSLQHAFPTSERPANFIEISLEVSDPIGQELPHYTLFVEDDGVGLPAGALAASDQASGLGFVRHMAERYGGKLTVSYDRGTRVSFEVGNCSTG